MEKINHPRIDNILNAWRDVNNLAVEYGEELYKSDYFKDAMKRDKSIDQVYNEVVFHEKIIKNT